MKMGSITNIKNMMQLLAYAILELDEEKRLQHSTKQALKKIL